MDVKPRIVVSCAARRYSLAERCQCFGETYCHSPTLFPTYEGESINKVNLSIASTYQF
jgi:hypothetical protein